MNYWIL